METEVLQSIVATNRWGVLLPEIFLGCCAVLILFVDLMLPSMRRYLAGLSSVILLLAALLVGWDMRSGAFNGEYFAGLLMQDSTADWMRLFFLFCGLAVVHLSAVFLRRQPLVKVELYHLVLVVTAGFMVLVQSNHFILLFVALETVTIGFYILVAYRRTSRASLEAGLKYLIMGALSSGILLFGIALLYAAASNPLLPGTAAQPLHFGELGSFIAAWDDLYANQGNYLVLFGAALVMVGIAFKIGLVPFQMWIPDVYQGAPTPVTALLAVASKAAGFYVMYLLLTGPFAALDFLLVPMLTVSALLTMVFGNIAALGQRNVKRVMGLSGVAHAGILMLGLLASLQVEWAFAAVLFYLVTYAIASFGVFEVMAHVADPEDDNQELDHYDDLLKKDVLLGGTLLVSLGSLAGIPPLAGFIAKLLIFLAAFQAQLYLLLGVALAGVVVSIYYYFSWMRAAVMHNPFLEDEQKRELLVPAFGAKVMMGLLVAATLVLGLYQGMFTF